MINKSPKIAYGVVAALAVVVASVAWSQFRSPPELTRSWFTIDDGKTYFADDITKVPPFTKDLKTVYGCEVFTCDGGKTTFVGFLVRYRDGAEQELKSLVKPAASSGTEMEDYFARRNAIEVRTREVKRPQTGDNGWVLERSGDEGPAITNVKCTMPGGVLESVPP